MTFGTVQGNSQPVSDFPVTESLQEQGNDVVLARAEIELVRRGRFFARSSPIEEIVHDWRRHRQLAVHHGMQRITQRRPRDVVHHEVSVSARLRGHGKVLGVNAGQELQDSASGEFSPNAVGHVERRAAADNYHVRVPPTLTPLSRIEQLFHTAATFEDVDELESPQHDLQPTPEDFQRFEDNYIHSLGPSIIHSRRDRNLRNTEYFVTVTTIHLQQNLD